MSGPDHSRRAWCLGGACRLAALVLVLGATVRGIGAQERPAVFEFSFTNPGARSMGFGGAFAPLADDATAAFANPAGLVQLVRPELSAELRADVALARQGSDDERSTFRGLGFFSAVYPGRRWSVALYGHRLASIEFINTADGAGGLGVQKSASASRLAEEGLGQFEVVRVGLAGGYRLQEKLSLGLGVSFLRGTLDPGDGNLSSVRLTERSDWAANGGLLWTMSEAWHLGAFYRQGPRFGLASATTGATGSLSLPDAYGLGASFRSPDGALTLATEWDRLRYSRVGSGLQPVLQQGLRLRFADVSELHFGGEYAFLQGSPVFAIRLGAWFDPEHRFRLVDDGHGGVLEQGEGDTLHGAVGVGWAFRRFQLDLGLDYASTVTSLSVSAILSL